MTSPDTAAAARPRSTDDGPDVVRVRVLAGPSLWRRDPVVTGDVIAGPVAARPAALAAVTARVTGELPGLAAIDEGGAPGTEPVDADPPLAWAALVARLALALQQASGGELAPWWRAAPGDAPDARAIALAFEEEDVGLASVRAAARTLRRAVAGDALDLARTLDDLRERHERERLDPAAAAIVAEAHRRGISVRRYPRDRVVQLGLGARQRRLDGTLTSGTGVIAADLAADEPRARRTLARLGVPVPRGDVARDAGEAVEIAEDVGFPVRVVPLDGRDRPVERAASGALDSAAALRDAFATVRADHPRVVVERWAAGREHRVLVVAGRVVAVAERTPAHGAGDGARAVDRTDAMHPANAAICAFAADAVGLDVAGVDLVARDVAVPLAEQGALVVAVHAAPGIGVHAPRDVPGAILDALFPEGAASARVPIVAVTGTNGKTTTTRLVAHLLRAAGLRTGFTTTDGVYFGEHLVFAGDMTGPMAADMVLSNPRVEAAVLETARGGILRAGLGYDACDVGVVLNVTPDHLGLRGIHTVEQLADVKAVIVSAVRPGGHAVLNADDPLVWAMRERTPAQVVLFSLGGRDDAPHVAAHVAAGGMAVTVEREALVLHRGAERVPLLAVTDIPLTEGGAARFQLQNAAAATAAAWAAGVAPEVLRDGLTRFVPSAATTPGRMNVVRVRGATVIVDYAHNPAAIRALLDYARRVDAGRRIAVLSTPGDRRDADIREVGGLAAGLDAVVFMENAPYRRGRPVGDGHALLVDGLRAAGGDPSRATLVDGEEEAVDAVLALLRPRDLVLFVADDAALVIERLEAGEGDSE